MHSVPYQTVIYFDRVDHQGYFEDVQYCNNTHSDITEFLIVWSTKILLQHQNYLRRVFYDNLFGTVIMMLYTYMYYYMTNVCTGLKLAGGRYIP